MLGPKNLPIFLLLLLIASNASAAKNKCAALLSSAEYQAFDARYEGWREIELGAIKVPVHPHEHEAMIGKNIAIYVEDKLDLDRRETIEGIVEEVPVYGDNNRVTYDVRLPNGQLRKVELRGIQEIRVYVEPSAASTEVFQAKFGAWRQVELGLMGFPKNDLEYGALQGKHAAFFIRDDFDFGRTEIVEGTIEEVPVFRSSQTTYDVRTADGAIRQVTLRGIQELRVNVPPSIGSAAEFNAKFSGWYAVELNTMGLPKEPLKYDALLGMRAAFYVEDDFDFGRSEIIEGRVKEVPVWGDDSRTTYDIEMADGTVKKIESPRTVKHLRIKRD